MDTIQVIKIGGNVIANPKLLKPFIEGFKSIDGNKILVHGGGKLATELATKMGVKSKMIEGRRVTDDQTIDIVTMVYGGLVNKTLVAQLQSSDINAIGLSGADGNLLKAKKRTTGSIDYGWVGDFDPSDVNTSLLSTLLNSGYQPVVCSLSHDKAGQMLNTNADTIATNIAIALSATHAVTLQFCFDQKGVMRDLADESSIISEISYDSFQEMKSNGSIFAGMIPKLDNAFDAMTAGVKNISLGRADLIGSSVRTSLIL